MYDRDGNKVPGTQEEVMRWYGEHLADFEYKVVSNTTIGALRVSTIWLGLDHNFGEDGNPIIFETMVFREECFTQRTRYGDEGYIPFIEAECQRYTTEEEALLGHRSLCAVVEAFQDEFLHTIEEEEQQREQDLSDS